VICGFRPEAVVLDPNSPLRMRVAVTEPTGAETHVFGQLGATDVIAVVRERVSYSQGQEMGVSIAPDQLHIFDATTKVRLN
jgi:multiple sugar transport system ATP-binding protein